MPIKNLHAVALGQRGGAVTSPAKVATAIENGRKGGRPPLPRCACGTMTARRAKASGHDCISQHQAMCGLIGM